MSKTKTTYTVIPDSKAFEEETFATKQAAIRAGERTGVPFYVRTSGGAVVYNSVPEDEAAPAADETVDDSEEDVLGPSKDEDGTVLNYREHGPKHFFKALTQPVLDRFKGSSRGRDFTISVPTAEAGRVVNAWDDALEALKEFKKENAGYRRQSTKTDAGRKLRYEMEQEFLSAAVKKALR